MFCRTCGSRKLECPKVVQVDNAFNLTAAPEHDERRDLLVFHQCEGRGGESAAFYGEGKRVHDLACVVFQCVRAVAFEQTAEIPVGDHAGKAPFFGDGGHAEFFPRHFVDDLGHGGGGDDLRDGVAGVHEFANACQAASDAASGVQVCEVFCAPSAAATGFKSKGIAEREHDGGRSGGGEVERAGFAGGAGVEEDVCGLRKRGGAAAAEGDEGCVEALENGEEAEELFGFAAVGEREDGVPGGKHAEIAVYGFGSVEEVSGCAGGAKGGGDLAGDDAAFADAGDDDAFGVGLEEEFDGGGEGSREGAVEAVGELVERRGFDAHELGGAEWV